MNENNQFWIIVESKDGTERGLHSSSAPSSLMFDTKGRAMTVVETLPIIDWDYNAAKKRFEKCEIEIKKQNHLSKNVFLQTVLFCLAISAICIISIM